MNADELKAIRLILDRAHPKHKQILVKVEANQSQSEATTKYGAKWILYGISDHFKNFVFTQDTEKGTIWTPHWSDIKSVKVVNPKEFRSTGKKWYEDYSYIIHKNTVRINVPYSKSGVTRIEIDLNNPDKEQVKHLATLACTCLDYITINCDKE